ncbi:MAG: DEAD/DEAH box helicase [Candidatus Nanopelagicales bacterium]|nr:DEAD/DEAH box helicase [Candidatus Nanopelagicales bacterium]MDP4824753.1 DEAD/DEAH box helicase [Candidatus Nanopelagicales bacterium]MDP4888594.1 DEAD/DEAH box helicase [Candidatus Nanopelagicales bacterium]
MENPLNPVTDTTQTETAVAEVAADNGIEESPLTPPEIPPTFTELGADPAIVAALAEQGIEQAFPIQAMCLPLAREGRDLIGQAKTGTGKTLGFGIPLLMNIESSGTKGAAPQALIVVPTRELCLQVATDLERASAKMGTRVLSVYGGRAYEPQIDALTRGVEVVVGTPGRLIDLAQRGNLRLGEVRVLVLDEADEMLDMGFLPDVERIVALIPPVRQTMLFSATMPGQIVNLARRYMTKPTHIRASTPGDESATVDTIEQHVWRAHPMDKVELLARILQAKDRGLVMVFTRTKRKAQKVADDLTERGFAVASVHGDLGQGAREQALRAFRTGKVDVLVATDVAARGIDVEGVTHVINYECPDDEKTYLHRVGRTGRAGASGVAVTLVDWADIARWQMINKALGLAFAEPVETYSTSDHVFTGLSIDPRVSGKLPRTSRTRAGLGAEQVEDIGGPGKSGGQKAARTPHGSRTTDAPAKKKAATPDATKRRQRRRTRGGTGPASAPAK